MPRSENKVAIVTGASSGLGLALAQHLLSSGWNVAGFDVRPTIEDYGEHFLYCKCDVSDYDSQAAGFTAAFQKWGRIDTLCANAGIIDQSSVYIFGHRGKTDIPLKPNTLCTDVDYKGVVYGTQLAIHFMRQNEPAGGSIVTTASIVGVHPFASLPEYCGAKAANIAFVRAMAPILKSRENITINAICPGVLPTPQIPQMMRDNFGSEGMTPLTTITSGYTHFLTHPDVTGQIMECSVLQQRMLDGQLFADGPEGEITKKTCLVYDPLFKGLHGEASGLEGAMGVD